MPTIKRYPNRKLYNTETKQYVTLERIASLVREGQDVRVVDYATGEDLTAITLTQIVFDQEKKAGGFVPHSVLSGLVQAGGKTLAALQHSLASPLGLWVQVDEEITRRINVLVQIGELSEEEGARLCEKLLSQGVRPQERDRLALSDQAVQRVLDRRGVPTRQDLQRLAQRLDDLTNKLDQLGRDTPITPARRTRRTRT